MDPNKESGPLSVSLIDMVASFSGAIDLISPVVGDHHRRVAYIAACIAAEMGLSDREQLDVLLAGSMHDAGALSLKDRLDALGFEAENPMTHCELGYRLLRGFEPLAGAAELVRYHHHPWNDGAGREYLGEGVPIGSHVLHLADRVDVLISRKNDIFQQVNGICEKVGYGSGGLFEPESLAAFQGVARNDNFWLSASSELMAPILESRMRQTSAELGDEGLQEVAALFSRIIDFRSRFTAIHSSGVAGTAEALAGHMGLSARDAGKMKVAGYLHDLGKLAVPSEILDKPGRLDLEEERVVKSHPLWTYKTLRPITSMRYINECASYHHERMDGRGYPFGRDKDTLSLGAKIIAASDIFTALLEDRPYRRRMGPAEAVLLMDWYVADGAIDGAVVETLKGGFDAINAARERAQLASAVTYEEFRRPVRRN